MCFLDYVYTPLGAPLNYKEILLKCTAFLGFLTFDEIDPLLSNPVIPHITSASAVIVPRKGRQFSSINGQSVH